MFWGSRAGFHLSPACWGLHHGAEPGPKHRPKRETGTALPPSGTHWHRTRTHMAQNTRCLRMASPGVSHGLPTHPEHPGLEQVQGQSHTDKTGTLGERKGTGALGPGWSPHPGHSWSPPARSTAGAPPPGTGHRELRLEGREQPKRVSTMLTSSSKKTTAFNSKSLRDGLKIEERIYEKRMLTKSLLKSTFPISAV